jgi:hypothetical protein
MTTAAVGPAPVTVVGPGASPSNVVKPTAAAPVQPVPAAAPATPSELEAARAKVKDLENKVLQAQKANIIERRQAQREREAKEKSMGERLKKADAYDKLTSMADVDPESAAKHLWKDKWYDRLVEAKLNGGAPSGEVVAHKLADLEAKFEQRLTERETASKAAQDEAAQKANESVRSGIGRDAVMFHDAKLEEYPIFKQLGGNERVASLLMSRIEANKPMLAKYRSALEYDDADARVDILEWAAKGLESDALRLAESMVGVDKYKPRFADKLQPGKSSGTVVKQSQQPSMSQPSPQQPGRALSNDMTAATPASRSGPRSDKEREAAAIEAYNAVKTARTQR